MMLKLVLRAGHTSGVLEVTASPGTVFEMNEGMAIVTMTFSLGFGTVTSPSTNVSRHTSQLYFRAHPDATVTTLQCLEGHVWA